MPPMTSCSLCVTVDKLQIQGDDLTFCGKYQVNCSLGIKREIPIPCINITNCSIYGCDKGCNNGVCGPTGVCLCQPGYYGTDCSISLSGNCLLSSNSPSGCWEFGFPDCKTMSITTSAGVQGPQSVDQSSVMLVPCHSVPNSQCQLCLDAENVHPVSNQLVGCPVIRVNCNGTELRQDLACRALATSNSLVCPGAGGDGTSALSWGTTAFTTTLASSATSTASATTDTDTLSTTKIILIVLVVVLAVSVLAFAAQFAYRKYMAQQEVAFQRLPTTDREEAVPLGGQATDNL